MEICQVCGDVVDILTNNHCLTKHGLTKAEYRAKYGRSTTFIPITKAMSDADLYIVERKKSFATK